MAVYCYGLKAKYDAALASGKPFYKYGRDVGHSGAVFRTPAEVSEYLDKNAIRGRDVYKVDADWDQDTRPTPGEPFHHLVKTSLITACRGNVGYAPTPLSVWRKSGEACP